MEKSYGLLENGEEIVQSLLDDLERIFKDLQKLISFINIQKLHNHEISKDLSSVSS